MDPTHADRSDGVPATTERLLDDIRAFIRSYIVLDSPQYDAITLWVAHTHAFDAAQYTPYLAISSVEKASGKTQLLSLLSHLVRNPEMTGGISAAYLIRIVDSAQPTLLLDESDALFGGDREFKEKLRGILNTGFRAGGRYAMAQSTGQDWIPVKYSTFCPKAIAGIGRHLPDTVLDRSVPIEMRRRRPNEAVRRFRDRDVSEEARPITERLKAWAEAATSALEHRYPQLPESLPDRAADIWEPLVAIADLGGSRWGRDSRVAAVTLSATSVESLRVCLLADLQRVFGARDDRMASEEIVAALRAMPDRPWRDANPVWGATFDPRALARLLKVYGIEPKTLRFPDGRTLNGYERSALGSAWTRHLPGAGRSPSKVNEVNEVNADDSAGRAVDPVDPVDGGDER